MQRFEFDFDPRFKPMLLVLGVRPGNSEVRLTDDEQLVATFGPFRLETPLDNVSCAQITEDYRWFKAIGPRGSFKDGGVTFGSNARRGVCVEFHKPVKALLGNLLPHPGATFTVADCDGLVAALKPYVDAA